MRCDEREEDSRSPGDGQRDHWKEMKELRVLKSKQSPVMPTENRPPAQWLNQSSERHKSNEHSDADVRRVKEDARVHWIVANLASDKSK